MPPVLAPWADLPRQRNRLFMRGAGRASLMSLTKGAAGGGDPRAGAAAAAGGPEAGAALGAHPEAARPREQDEGPRSWLEWCEKWIGNMPEGNPEEYAKRAREDCAKHARRISAEEARRLHSEHAEQMRSEHAEQMRSEHAKKILDELTLRNIEEATNRQIMVTNFETFRREYIDMTFFRSC